MKKEENKQENQPQEEYKHLKGWVKRLATLDPPTGLLNRHGWVLFALRHLKRGARDQKSFGILIASVDNFTRLIDELGYEVGEEALQHVAEVMEGQLRGGDLLGRWLEDQFILLLTNIAPEVLRAVAARIKNAVDSSPFMAGDHLLSITVSLGGATKVVRVGDPKELDNLITEADSRLTQAKRQGPNRVVV